MHFADNLKLILGNKTGKISPLYDIINKNLVQFDVFYNFISIHESMVLYYGCHSAKMFIKEKPMRIGYKIWCICGNNGFPYHMKIY